MKNLHVFVSSVTEKVFSQTVKKQNPGVKKSKNVTIFFKVDFENARRVENETRLRVSAPFCF